MGIEQPVVVILPALDRFEDFYPKMGVTLRVLREENPGGWLFNYVEALQSARVRPVVIFVSVNVSEPVRFTHRPSGAAIRVLPSPRLHQKLRGARARFLPRSRSTSLRALESYVATPVRLLARELRREACEVILCQEYEHPRFDVSVALGALSGRRVFATFQGADHTRSPLERPVRRLALRGCTGVIVGSSAEVRRVRTRYRLPPSKVAHIPSPVTGAWRPGSRAEARARLGLPTAACIAVWHGRVKVDVKGLDVLVEAWRRLCGERPDAPLLLLLIGTGSDAGQLRHRLDVLDPAKVRWVDAYLRDPDLVRQHLLTADVATLPSRREGFPMALIEAMACGLPVVATDVHGVADILAGGGRSGGLIVPREDPAALAGALGRILDDAGWAQQLGLRARRRAQELFSLEAVGGQLREYLFATQTPTSSTPST